MLILIIFFSSKFFKVNFFVSYIKEIAYLKTKEYFQKEIENIFKEEITKVEDLKNFDYHKYIYHYTDAESALSILIDEQIYPHYTDQNDNKKVCFTNVEPNRDDKYIAREVFNLDSSYRGPLLRKLQFAFGIHEKIYSLSNHFSKVSLDSHKFILVVRNF